MKINDDKSLIESDSRKINGSSFKNFIEKVKAFFKKKKQEIDDNKQDHNNNQDRKNIFMDSLKVEESEETKILRLQKKYRSGEIKEEDLSEEQIAKMIELYDKQIKNKEKEIEIKKARIAKLKASN